MQVPTNTLWFGIDVSKATFDVALGPIDHKRPPHQKFPRTQAGCRSCLTWASDLVPGGTSNNPIGSGLTPGLARVNFLAVVLHMGWK